MAEAGSAADSAEGTAEARVGRAGYEKVQKQAPGAGGGTDRKKLKA